MPPSKHFMEEIIKKLDELIIKVDKLEGASSKKQKVKVKRETPEYKVPDDSNRCTIKKINGERCKGKLAKNNEKQCQLHLNKSNGVGSSKSKKPKAESKTNKKVEDDGAGYFVDSD